jgi:hypothetical protein
MKKKRFSRLDYCQYLLSSPVNYTLTNMADHVENLSHDRINRYLRNEKLSPKLVWEHIKDDIIESDNGYLLFDDTVIDKNYSFEVENARYQYSGNAHEVKGSDPNIPNILGILGSDPYHSKNRFSFSLVFYLILSYSITF